MMDDLIDNIAHEGTDLALIMCDKCQFNKSCELYERGVRSITNCNSYQEEEA